jgi:hypothetical protein
VDHSNLWISAREEALKQGEPVSALRLDVDRLYEVAAAHRPAATSVIVANRSTPDGVLVHQRRLFDVRLVEAGRCAAGQSSYAQMSVPPPPVQSTRSPYTPSTRRGALRRGACMLARRGGPPVGV